MTIAQGKIVLMGSGELTATMVEVHKELLSVLGPDPKAVFLDTPAGFQLNCDQISDKAVEYFRRRVGADLTVASFKSADAPLFDTELAYKTLKEADFVLIGPGSPTYAVKQLLQSPIPDIFEQLIVTGGCLVSASAAALTMGRFTLPVYEIYKVGKSLYWEEGTDLMGRFGFDLVVVPHWNNAEGGTHDTRCCFMGKPRFEKLASFLPDDIPVLGIDEHTALILDFKTGSASIRGLGKIVIRRHGKASVIEKGSHIPLTVFHKDSTGITEDFATDAAETSEIQLQADEKAGFWDKIHQMERDFRSALDRNDGRICTNILLELDSLNWRANAELQDDASISQAREVLRDLLVLFGTKLNEITAIRNTCPDFIVEALVRLRQTLRRDKRFEDADTIRDILLSAGVLVEDTPEGPRWRSEQ
jgi:hypothetical protein